MASSSSVTSSGHNIFFCQTKVCECRFLAGLEYGVIFSPRHAQTGPKKWRDSVESFYELREVGWGIRTFPICLLSRLDKLLFSPKQKESKTPPFKNWAENASKAKSRIDFNSKCLIHIVTKNIFELEWNCLENFDESLYNFKDSFGQNEDFFMYFIWNTTLFYTNMYTFSKQNLRQVATDERSHHNRCDMNTLVCIE